MNRFARMIPVLLLALVTTQVYSQKDYMHEIVNNACECIQEVSDTLDPDMYNMELGFCILEAAMPYKKQLKKYHDIDFDRIDEQGEELGMIIGMKMAGVCPEALMAAAGNVLSEETDEMLEEDDSSFLFEGVITAIDDSQFVVFSIKDMMGKTVKFYWLTFLESDIDLPLEYKELVGSNVLISYSNSEYFDPRIGEYRIINVLESIFTTDYYAE